MIQNIVRSQNNVRVIRYRGMQLFGLIVLLSFSNGASAQCGGDYVVESGDSLTWIARNELGDARKWTAIYQANVSVIGENPDLIQVGDTLRIPCLDVQADASEADTTVASAPVESAAGQSVLGGETIRLLTGDDYAPWTDRNLPDGGLFTELVDQALSANGNVNHTIGWVNDWAAHLDPLLTEHAYDMGFPWFKPNCAQTPDAYRCQNFKFSEPLFEMLILLYTRTESPITYASDDDIVGKTLCRPTGWFTHDLDKNGRRWVADNRIELRQPVQVDDCFEMLMSEEVDAVTLNEFTGRTAIQRLGLEDDVTIIDSKPLSIEGLRVLVHKTHPHADDLVESVNESLRLIQSSGKYQEILDKHLTRFWAQF